MAGLYNKKFRQYRIWVGMRSRCNNPNVPIYRWYGGRGIKVCQRWDSFANFWEDMAEGYKDDLQIDRINSDGNYEPKNCRWATKKEQANNLRSNRLITINNETKTLAQWIDNSSVKSSTVKQRFYVYKWSIEKSLGLTGY